VVVVLIQFRTVDVFNRCFIRRVLLPADVPEAMWHVLDMLVATDALDHDSDSLNELRKPLRCYGGLDGSGRQGTTTTAGPSNGASATSPTEGRRMAGFEPTQLEPAVPDGRGPSGSVGGGSGTWHPPWLTAVYGATSGATDRRRRGGRRRGRRRHRARASFVHARHHSPAGGHSCCRANTRSPSISSKFQACSFRLEVGRCRDSM
jgi:hypothetical protein